MFGEQLLKLLLQLSKYRYHFLNRSYVMCKWLEFLGKLL